MRFYKTSKNNRHSYLSSILKQHQILFRFRNKKLYRKFIKHLDIDIFVKLTNLNFKVAIKLLRDISWLYYKNSQEPYVIDTILRITHDIRLNSFWDIGANIGYYSWLILSNTEIDEILLIEPDPNNYSLIQKTIKKNKIEKANVLNIAISDINKKELFLVDDVTGAAGSLLKRSHIDNKFSLQYHYGLNDCVEVETKNLDNLLLEGYVPPDIIKIDVEGSESLVFKGAQRLLKEIRPFIFVESDIKCVDEISKKYYYDYRRLDNINFFLTPL